MSEDFFLLSFDLGLLFGLFFVVERPGMVAIESGSAEVDHFMGKVISLIVLYHHLFDLAEQPRQNFRLDLSFSLAWQKHHIIQLLD
jgi:hypothetical protein